MFYRVCLCFSIVSSMLFLTACNDLNAWYARKYRQKEVSSGIARLSAQHLSLITSEVSKQLKDKNTPFTVVKATDASEHGKGTVTKVLKNIDLDFPEEKMILEDCLGNKAYWKGSIHVEEATLSVYGRLTNNNENPVVPDIGGVRIALRVKPTNSKIRFSNKDSHIELHHGEISFEAIPRLAQAQDGPMKGLRLVPTSNTRFEHVMMKDVKGTLTSPKVTMEFDVKDSDYLIQVGAGDADDENKLTGSMTAFGNAHTIPDKGDALNPDYDADEFVKTYACKDEFKGVVEFGNVVFEDKLGPGMAALTTLAMSKIASKFAEDHVCGMSSPSFMRGIVISGEMGSYGENNAELKDPCSIQFENYVTQPDCFGIAYEMSGKATVTHAKSTVSGLVLNGTDAFEAALASYEGQLSAKDADVKAILLKKPEPVIPHRMQPAVLDLTADVSDITVKEVCLNEGSVNHEYHCTKMNSDENAMSFSLKAGEIRAKLKPVMAKDTDPTSDRNQMCVVKTIPVAEAKLVLKQVTAVIKKSGNEFDLMADGTYRAISGVVGEHENELSGGIAIGKTNVAFRSTDREFLPLKPDYERTRYVDSYQSCMVGKFVMPASDDDCSLDELFGLGDAE